MLEIVRTLVFYVNGRRIEEKNVDHKMNLATYLRENLKLTGTKIGCNEGGCGACTVMLSDQDPKTEDIRHYSVNACLTPVCSVFGKAVTTIEGIGNFGRKMLHPIQERLAMAHGSQCGFCTPGFVMAMYALLRNSPNPSMNEIDESMQGNLCRCTGYRPILEAFYSFANDQNNNLKITESSACGMGDACCRNKKKDEGDMCDRKDIFQLTTFDSNAPYNQNQEPIFPPELKLKQYHKKAFKLKTDECIWYQPTTIDKLVQLKAMYPFSRLISGNSEVAIELKFRFIELPIIINPKQIAEMRNYYLDDDGAYMGTNLSLSEIKVILSKWIEELPPVKTQIFQAVVSMLHYFAGKHVRNTASVAGNIVTASPISDLNPVWMAAGASIELVSEKRGRRIVKIDEHFFVSYRKTIIETDEIMIAIIIPFSTKNQIFQAFKQAQRREDDIAIVTAALSVDVDPDTKNINDIKISFGGMAPVTKLALKTMKALKNRTWTKDVTEIAYSEINNEFKLPMDVPGGMSRYRMSLTLSFFFKFYVYVSKQLTEHQFDDYGVESALIEPSLPPFKTSQIYFDVPKHQPDHDPVGRPLQHVSGEKHTTGEAIYCSDVKIADCLHMAFLLAPVASARINSVDYTEAMKLPGVRAYFDRNDIAPGTKIGHGDTLVYAEDEITYHGQPIAAIVAEDHETARKAVSKIKLDFTVKKPILTIEQAKEAGSVLHISGMNLYSSYTENNNQRIFFDYDKIKRKVTGVVKMGGQEHFYLETQQCIAIPLEDDELDIISSTQCVSDVQRDVCTATKIPRHKLNVRVRRIGGGFGGKESTGGMLAAPAAIAALKLRQPVKLVLERFDDMALTGTRHPFNFEYTVALGDDNKLESMDVTCLSNCGYTADLSGGVMARCIVHMDNSYKWGNIDVHGVLCQTNTSSNTAFRGFGGPQAMFGTETMLVHLAEEFGLDVDELREQNMYKEGQKTHFGMTLNQCNVERCWYECKQLADYANRKKLIEQFNEHSRYKKRGIFLTPTKFAIGFGFKQLNQGACLIHIYLDGSVLVSHGAMEMGQGLHTKILQITARCLDIPIEKIHIHDTATDKVPNASPTAASVGSDLIGIAIENGCKTINERLAPFKKAHPEDGWDKWVSAAYVERISLSTTGFGIITSETIDFFNGKGAEAFGYCVYGTACAEVEIDCLTGDHHIIRSDIVMDIGDSLNPAVDIGQIEGAFIQGYGLYTMEEIKMRSDGVRHTRGPGTYKIPSADDVPRHFNVKLLKGSSNNRAIFSSKAVGEPPLHLGSVVFFAIREAIKAYRKEHGVTGYFRFDSPATPERIRMHCSDKITSKIYEATEGYDSVVPWNVEL
uniref:Xanthine dehydrogenase n=1 Tax=Rhabditophanes sp. KR3021 TaxID=114890 RepID=A0AC35U6V0_9BILA